MYYNHVFIAKKLPQKLDKTKNKPIAQTITFIFSLLSKQLKASLRKL